MSTSKPVIVFGPAGGVGSWTAISAFENGASKVILAMRDPSKPLPKELVALENKHPNSFERVKADLMDPDSVLQVVRTTKTKNAFIYMIYGAQDSMKGVLQALKEGGIEHVVFLSSSSVTGQGKALLDYTEDQFLPRVHGGVEYALEEVFGIDGGFTALRPAFFASNLSQDKDAINAGNVRVYDDRNIICDMIAPEDIGRVGGICLTQGKHRSSRSERIPINGKEQIPLIDAYDVVKKMLNKKFEVTGVDMEGFVDSLVEDRGMPLPFAMAVTRFYAGMGDLIRGPRYSEGVKNVKKITGKEPLSLVEWLKVNKDKFN